MQKADDLYVSFSDARSALAQSSRHVPVPILENTHSKMLYYEGLFKFREMKTAVQTHIVNNYIKSRIKDASPPLTPVAQPFSQVLA